LANSPRNEKGAGLIGTFLGTLVFLAFCALAAHTLVGLYATSTITAVAWDEARLAATSSASPEAIAQANDRLATKLAGYDNTNTEWQLRGDESLGLTVSVDRPALLPPALAEASELDRIERTVWVRIEEMR
jgi:hypothetical protein